MDRTSGEGEAQSFDVGLPPLDPKLRIPGEEPDADTEDDDLEDVDESGSTRSKPKVPSRGDVQREYALEVGGVVYSNHCQKQYNGQIPQNKLCSKMKPTSKPLPLKSFSRVK